MLAVSLYIHLNPVRAGLVSDPVKYRWATTRLYCEGSTRKSFVKTSAVLGLISSKDGKARKEQRKRYRDILRKASDLEIGEVMEQEGVIENFLTRLRGVIPSCLGNFFKINKIPAEMGINLISIEELEEKIREIREDPMGKRPETLKARRFLIEQLIARGYKREEIAQRLGMSRKTIYNILRKAPPS